MESADACSSATSVASGCGEARFCHKDRRILVYSSGHDRDNNSSEFDILLKNLVKGLKAF